LITYLFDLKFSKSLLAIFIGLILAVVIMIIFTRYISWMLTYLDINIKGNTWMKS
jgi:predicted tellurium resistance membrane protein TerC